jgi:hypothetical protein
VNGKKDGATRLSEFAGRLQNRVTVVEGSPDSEVARDTFHLASLVWQRVQQNLPPLTESDFYYIRVRHRLTWCNILVRILTVERFTKKFCANFFRLKLFCDLL